MEVVLRARLRAAVEARGQDRVPGLADREPPAEEIGSNEKRKRYPLIDLGEGVECPPESDADAGENREDEFGPLAKDATMRVTVCAGSVVMSGVVDMWILVRVIVLLAQRVVVTVVAGKCCRFSGDGSCDLHTERGECLTDGRLVRVLAVELDADRAVRVGLGLDDAWSLLQQLGDSPSAALVTQPFAFPEHVSVAPGDMSPGLLGDPPDAGERELSRVVMDAYLGGLAALGGNDVGVLHASRRCERSREAGHAGIAGIGHVWEEDGKVEA